jgi:hypothetical protein
MAESFFEVAVCDCARATARTAARVAGATLAKATEVEREIFMSMSVATPRLSGDFPMTGD